MSYLSDKLPENPITLFEEWFELAKSTSTIKNPEAACLSTIGADGFPQGRVILIRGVSQEGFDFYTNSNSAKGIALASNPKSALTVYWEQLNLQVRIQGICQPVTDDESDAYFEKRPRGSQIGAWASAQSEELASRAFLEDRVKQYETEFSDETITRPPHWKGYRVFPVMIEFWEEQAYRLHDRIAYYRQEDGTFVYKRLFP